MIMCALVLKHRLRVVNQIPPKHGICADFGSSDRWPDIVISQCESVVIFGCGHASSARLIIFYTNEWIDGCFPVATCDRPEGHMCTSEQIYVFPLEKMKS